MRPYRRIGFYCILYKEKCENNVMVQNTKKGDQSVLRNEERSAGSDTVRVESLTTHFILVFIGGMKLWRGNRFRYK